MTFKEFLEYVIGPDRLVCAHAQVYLVEIPNDVALIAGGITVNVHQLSTRANRTMPFYDVRLDRFTLVDGTRCSVSAIHESYMHFRKRKTTR